MDNAEKVMGHAVDMAQEILALMAERDQLRDALERSFVGLNAVCSALPLGATVDAIHGVQVSIRAALAGNGEG